jgi:PmbA protein
MSVKEKFSEIIEKVLALCSGFEAEVFLSKSSNSLTRFTQNYIHQNMSSENTELQLRVILNKSEGSFSTNRLDDEGIKEAVKSAVDIAKCSSPIDDFQGLASSVKKIEFENYASSTAECSPEKRASIVAEIVRYAKSRKSEAAGAVSTNSSEIAIVNSSGVHSLRRTTTAELNLVPSRNFFSGYSYWIGTDIDKMPLGKLIREAVEFVLSKEDPLPLDPGSYTVVLSPYAVAALVRNLSYIGFGAKAYLEKRSFMTKLMGEKVASELISIYDDGMDPDGLPSVFDYEGIPKKRVSFIDKGIAAGVVYDSKTADLSGNENTGHALPAPNTIGPFATNLFMSPGNTDPVDLISGVKHGIYINKFHYMNIVEPVSTVMTGMTKDGTFLIKNGKITSPVRNLRFTQNVLEALKNTEAVGKERRLVKGYADGTVLAPGLRIKDFNFSGVSGI